MVSIEYLQEFPYLFTQGGQIKRARLLRGASGDDPKYPKSTDVNILFGGETPEWYMEISGIQGKLPANIKLFEFEGGGVLVSPEQEPDKWMQIDGDEDLDALRVFSLLDPRLVIRNADMDRTEIIRDPNLAVTSVRLHVDLHLWKPELPGAFVAWLKGGAYDRIVTLRFREAQLVSSVQGDLPPWQVDRIIAEFE